MQICTERPDEACATPRTLYQWGNATSWRLRVNRICTHLEVTRKSAWVISVWAGQFALDDVAQRLMSVSWAALVFVSVKKKSSFPFGLLFGQVEHMFQFHCDLLYLLQLQGEHDFSSLYFEKCYILSQLQKYMTPPLQRRRNPAYEGFPDSPINSFTSVTREGSGGI